MVGVLCPWEGDLEDGIITVPVRWPKETLSTRYCGSRQEASNKMILQAEKFMEHLSFHDGVLTTWRELWKELKRE